MVSLSTCSRIRYVNGSAQLLMVSTSSCGEEGGINNYKMEIKSTKMWHSWFPKCNKVCHDSSIVNICYDCDNIFTIWTNNYSFSVLFFYIVNEMVSILY